MCMDEHNKSLMYFTGHIPVILWLLDHGAQACADNFGNTPLHDAAEHGQVQVQYQHTR